MIEIQAQSVRPPKNRSLLSFRWILLRIIDPRSVMSGQERGQYSSRRRTQVVRPQVRQRHWPAPRNSDQLICSSVEYICSGNLSGNSGYFPNGWYFTRILERFYLNSRNLLER
jgi:hypothetical protein